MNKLLIYMAIYLLGVIISSFSQILLKRSASKTPIPCWNNPDYIPKNFAEKYLLKNRNNKMISLIIKNEITVREYLNVKVILAYFMFFAATFLSLYAFKVIPLSMGPILEATQCIFVAFLSRAFLKEKVHLRKIVGFTVIVIGVIVFSI